MAEGGLEAAAKAPLGWAKARPVVFIILVLLIVVLVLRFRHWISQQIVKIPKLGPWLVGGKDSVPPAPAENP